MQELFEWQGFCPYCGESIDLFIDPSIEVQQYVEDCSVCCRPILVSVSFAESELDSVQRDREND